MEIKNNSNYRVFVFNSKDREEFIKKYFDENILKAYKRIIPGAYKCDFWRYCVLYIFWRILC